jgi:hypothetical protein
MGERFHTGQNGFLRDRNGDGFVDDLALRIVLPPDIDRIPPEIWRALIDLAARSGLETAGLPDRLTVDAGDPVPPDYFRLNVLHHGDGSERSIPIWTARDIEQLMSDESTPGDQAPAASSQSGRASLADLFQPGGLLVDRDDDLLADGTRVCLRLPEPCPASIGRAAIELAARIGMESGGIDLPIGLTASMDAPADAVVLDLAPQPCADLLAGHGLLSVGGDGLQLEGDGPGKAALAQFLASTWPNVRVAGTPETEIGRLLDQLRDLLTANSAEGRVAALISEIDDVPAGSTILLPHQGLDELALATNALHGRDMLVESDPDGRRVFALDWQGEWEVDDAREILAREVRPLLRDRSNERFELLVAVSEPREVRAELEKRLLAELGENVGVRVLSAYKLGLSWLREIVIPALSDLGDVDRVEIRYAPFEAEGYLDLRIRWLQELFPGDELLSAALGIPLEAIDLVEGTSGETHELTAFREGEAVWRDGISVFARSLPYVPIGAAKESVMASTGGVRLTAEGRVELERTIATDCDRFWGWFQAEVLPAVAEHIEQVTGGEPRADRQPFFDALEVDVWVSEPDESLGLREELDSAAEALHEDVYFGALDWFAAYGEAKAGTPFGAPGSIVPLVHVRRGAPAARVTLTAKRRHAAVARTPAGERRQIGSLDGLAVPKLNVTSITVGPRGLTELDVEMSGGDAGTQKLLAAASRLMEPPADRESLKVFVHVGDGQIAPIALPIPKPALAGVEPAAGAASDREIVFEGALPGRLARIAERPGVTVFQNGASFRGRPLWVVELTKPMPTARWSRAKLSMQKPTLLIAARHHANEVSSTTAAFLLAESLTGDGELRRLLDRVNVVFIPFENPDGAALHERLAVEHPTWKHHAARYNAVGFEFYMHLTNDATPYGEARTRPAMAKRWWPDVVVDNHGVPSHEWSQHYSGFGSPPRFPVSYWQVQALLYGIMRYVDRPEQTAFAERLRAKIAAELARNDDLRELNATFVDRYHRWGCSRVPDRFPSEIHEGFLCYMTRSEPDPESRNLGVRSLQSITLDWVTEVADETAHGDQLSATARCQLLANVVTLELMAESRNVPRKVVRGNAGGGVSVTIRRERPLTLA